MRPLLAAFMVSVMPAFAAPAPSKLAKPSFAAALEAFKKEGSEANREAVIKAATAAKPAPAVPAEARRPFVMAATYQKEAKSAADFGLAVDAYREALKVAPWWGDAYYNLSVALESAGRITEARDALQLYLLTKPKDAESVQDRLFTLEAKANLAAKAGAESAREDAEKAKTRIVPGVGVGPVRIGMTVDEADAAMPGGKRFDYDNNNGHRGVNLTWGAYPETVYADFYKYQATRFVTVSQKRYSTAGGLAPGSSVSDAFRVLGNPLRQKDYGSITEMCFDGGIGFGYNNGSAVIDHIFVYRPAEIKDRCPD